MLEQSGLLLYTYMVTHFECRSLKHYKHIHKGRIKPFDNEEKIVNVFTERLFVLNAITLHSYHAKESKIKLSVLP